MIEPNEAALRRALEPERFEVERIVDIALGETPATERKRIGLGVLSLVALAVFAALVVRKEFSPQADSAAVAALAQAQLQGQTQVTVRNFDRVLLVRGRNGRTLIASAGRAGSPETAPTPYRILVSKATAP